MTKLNVSVDLQVCLCGFFDASAVSEMLIPHPFGMCVTKQTSVLHEAQLTLFFGN